MEGLYDILEINKMKLLPKERFHSAHSAVRVSRMALSK